MILTGNEDLRVVKTIEAIKGAFEALICEKDYDKITVKELCERAKINKKTFYRHQGIATRIVEHLIAEAKARNIEKIYLETSADGERMYRKLGFKDMKGYMKL